MERAGWPRPLPDAGFGGADLHRLGRRPGRQSRRPGDPQRRERSVPAVLGALLVKVKVLFFASLREQLGLAFEEIDLPAGVSTVAALRSHLARRGGNWEGALAEKKNVRAAINQDMAKPGAAI